MDDVTWGALMVALTVLGGLYTWWAFRRRGVAAGLRGLALTLLPVAAWLTGTLGMFTRIARAISGWAAGLVFSPAVWIGVAAAGTSVLLWMAARGVDRFRPRDVTSRDGRGGRRSVEGSRTGRAVGPAPGDTKGEDEFSDIEALLRRRGIE